MNESTKTKKALRGSLFALFLCIVLLIGTTFAWFTDTASTGVNKIQSGNLKVGLQYSHDGGTTWKEAKNAEEIFAKDALWEPGHVEYVNLKVSNLGSLALKYKLGINVASETPGTNVNDATFMLSDYLKMAVVDGATKYDTRDAALTAAANGGTLADYTKDGTLAPKDKSAEGITDNNEVTVIVYMPETVGNEANYKTGTTAPSIDLGIKVTATQTPYESDSFNDQYDKNAPYTTVDSTADLEDAFKNVKAGEDVNVSLTGDVEMSDATLMVADEKTPDVGDINIVGNGHTITNSNDSARCIQIAKFTSDRKITISDANIVSKSTATDNSERRGIQIFSVNNATINLNNCDIEMKSKDYSYPVKIGGTSENLTINMKGCTLTGANCIESFGKNCTVNITDCVFNSNYAANEKYCGNGIQDKNGTNNTYNVKNTTFNGNNARAYDMGSGSSYNDLGGNVDNTTRTTK